MIGFSPLIESATIFVGSVRYCVSPWVAFSNGRLEERTTDLGLSRAKSNDLRATMNPNKHWEARSHPGHWRTSNLEIQALELILRFWGNGKVLGDAQ